MIALLIFFAALTCIFFCLIPSGVRRYGMLRKKGGRKRHVSVRNLRRAFLILVILPTFVTVASATGFVVTTVYMRKDSIPEPTPDPPEVQQPVEPTPDPPEILPQPDTPTVDLPTPPPISKEEELFSSFRLSNVKDSAMLVLDETLIGNATIDVNQMVTAADERFSTYIAQYCHPASFFPFYPNLSAFFPAGETVNYSFDSVFSLEDCNAQLRGMGECLERYKLINLQEQIGETCHYLAIRSRDALNFTKYNGTEDWSDYSIWLYSEISFAALINEYIYSQPKGLALSDWYYRMAQVFDYLGGVADTEELELRMYFLSATFLRCSFETLKIQGLQVYPETYDCEIWTLYVEMLYRLATHMDPTRAEGFYLAIQQIETTVLQQPLPETIITRTTKTLDSLTLYQEWRAQYG